MRAGFMWTTSERTVTDLSRELGKNFAGQTALHGGFSMNPSLLALAAVEIISHLKEELGNGPHPHCGAGTASGGEGAVHSGVD